MLPGWRRTPPRWQRWRRPESRPDRSRSSSTTRPPGARRSRRRDRPGPSGRAARWRCTASPGCSCCSPWPLSRWPAPAGRPHRARGRDPRRRPAPSPGSGLTVVTQPNFVAERGDQYLSDVPDRRPGRPVAGPFSGRRRASRWRPGPTPRSGQADPWLAIRAAVRRRTASGRALGRGRSGRAPDRPAVVVGYRARSRPARRQLQPGEPADLVVLAPPAPRPWPVTARSRVRATVIGGGSCVTRRKVSAAAPVTRLDPLHRCGRSRTSHRLDQSPAAPTTAPRPPGSIDRCRRRPPDGGRAGRPGSWPGRSTGPRRRSRARSTATAPTNPVIGSAMASPQKTGSCSASQPTSAARHGGIVAERHPVAAGRARPWPVMLSQTRPGRSGRSSGPRPSCSRARGREASITTSAASMQGRGLGPAGRAAKVELHRASSRRVHPPVERRRWPGPRRAGRRFRPS